MNIFFDQTKNVFFRMKLRFLQLVNKTSCCEELYMLQGECPPNYLDFLYYTCVLVYIQNAS